MSSWSEKIVGQLELRNHFYRMISNGNIPHSVLFVESEGRGALPISIEIAESILCKNNIDGKACGTCSSCLKNKKLIHPDLHFVFPLIGSQAVSSENMDIWRKSILEYPYLSTTQWKNALGDASKTININKKSCLEIGTNIKLKSFEGQGKVTIVWLPEYLGKEGNRLLKILEEPPENTYFILVTQNTDLILNTILSRCQTFRFPPINSEVLMDKLGNISDEESTSVSLLSEGSYSKALEVLNSTQSDNSHMFLSWLRKCFVGKIPDMVEWSTTLAALTKNEQITFLKFSENFLEEIVKLKLGINSGRLKNELLVAAEKIKFLLSFDQIQKLALLFSNFTYYIERNGNSKILFLDLTIKIKDTVKK